MYKWLFTSLSQMIVTGGRIFKSDRPPTPLSQSSSSVEEPIEEVSIDECIQHPQHTVQTHRKHFVGENLAQMKLAAMAKLKKSSEHLLLTNRNILMIDKALLHHQLRYLDVSDNRIEEIGECLRMLPLLETLKANNNLIKVVVTLPQVRHYYLLNNPIIKIEATVCQYSLVSLNCDWMLYMTASVTECNQNITARLGDILQNLSSNHGNQFVSLGQILDLMDFNRTVTMRLIPCVHSAILHNHFQVFDHLEKNVGICNIQALKYESKTLFQHALVQKCRRALLYFKQHGLCRTSRADYMHLACKHNNTQVFHNLLQSGFPVNCYDSHNNSLFHYALESFTAEEGPSILMSVLRGHYNPNHRNKRDLNCLLHAGNTSPHNLFQFLCYLQLNKHIAFFFNFDEVCGQGYSENILHLAVRTASLPLVKKIVDNNLVNPFVLSSLRKRPKQHPSLTIIKKYLSKYEKSSFHRMLSTRQKIRRGMSSSDGMMEEGTLEYQVGFQKVLEGLTRLHVDKEVSNEMKINHLQSLIDSTVREQHLSEMGSRVGELNTQQWGTLQEYSLFQGILSSRTLHCSNSQSISLLIKLQLRDDIGVCEQSAVKMEPRVIRTHQSNIPVHGLHKRLSQISCLDL